jgi:hypothetical protein
LTPGFVRPTLNSQLVNGPSPVAIIVGKSFYSIKINPGEKVLIIKKLNYDFKGQISILPNA